jgi:hypothetical protein
MSIQDLHLQLMRYWPQHAVTVSDEMNSEGWWPTGLCLKVLSSDAGDPVRGADETASIGLIVGFRAG